MLITLCTRNIRVIVFFLLIVALFLTMNVQKGFAATSATLEPPDHSVESDRLYGYAGRTIYFEWVNKNSKHNVGVGVYYESKPFSGNGKLVSKAKVAGYGNGLTWDTFTAPSNGYYYLRAVCGGKGQIGCNGRGILNTNF